jgi:hypothetical protein
VAGRQAQCLRSAAKGGHTDIVRWLHKERRTPWSAAAAIGAAKSGNLALVRWMQNHGCRWRGEMAIAAASAGHLATVRWLRNHDAVIGYAVLRAAAANGHTNIIDWATSICVSCKGREASLAFQAACNGHVAVLRWAYRRMTEPIDPEAGRIALVHRHDDVVKWWIAKRMPLCLRA